MYLPNTHFYINAVQLNLLKHLSHFYNNLARLCDFFVFILRSQNCFIVDLNTSITTSDFL